MFSKGHRRWTLKFGYWQFVIVFNQLHCTVGPRPWNRFYPFLATASLPAWNWIFWPILYCAILDIIILRPWYFIGFLVESRNIFYDLTIIKSKYISSSAKGNPDFIPFSLKIPTYCVVHRRGGKFILFSNIGFISKSKWSWAVAFQLW